MQSLCLGEQSLEKIETFRLMNQYCGPEMLIDKLCSFSTHKTILQTKFLMSGFCVSELGCAQQETGQIGES